MNKETIFKVISLGAMIVGGVAIAKAVAVRIRKEQDEEKAVDTMIEADSIVENFSGASGCNRNYGQPCDISVAGDMPDMRGVTDCWGRCSKSRRGASQSASQSASSARHMAYPMRNRVKSIDRIIGRG